jgi:hypothetical protein
MIDKALLFISVQINHYLHVKLNDTSSTEYIRPENVAWDDNPATSGATGAPATNLFVTLVNIEEDRISKSQDNYVRQGNTVVYRNPKVHLNLFVLFSSNYPEYKESLKMLSYIIQFFQSKNVFTPQNSPYLQTLGIRELIFDMVNIGFQDLNNLWGILGSKYLPSMLFKMRMVTISEDLQQGDAPLLNEILINDKTIPAS